MKIFISILLICFFGVNIPLLAQNVAKESIGEKENVQIEEENDSETDKSIKERKKNDKKKKGKRSSILQPSIEDDEDIILELDDDNAKP